MRPWPIAGLLMGLAAAMPLVRAASADPLDGRPLGRFTLTYYHVAQERGGGGDLPIFGPDCKQVIALTSRNFHDNLSLQGTGFLADGRLLNFEQRCGCALTGHGGARSCYRELERSQFPWGRGAYWNGQHFWLQPFRSVAVDPSVVAIGSVVFIPELAGYPLPDGAESNGCLRAEDTGIAIKGPHLDWFAGHALDNAWLRNHPPPREVTVFADSRRCTSAFP